jgi:hypothetical protein
LALAGGYLPTGSCALTIEPAHSPAKASPSPLVFEEAIRTEVRIASSELQFCEAKVTANASEASVNRFMNNSIDTRGTDAIEAPIIRLLSARTIGPRGNRTLTNVALRSKHGKAQIGQNISALPTIKILL